MTTDWMTDPRDLLHLALAKALRRQVELDDVDGGLAFIGHTCRHDIHCSVAFDLHAVAADLVEAGWQKAGIA